MSFYAVLKIYLVMCSRASNPSPNSICGELIPACPSTPLAGMPRCPSTLPRSAQSAAIVRGLGQDFQCNVMQVRAARRSCSCGGGGGPAVVLQHEEPKCVRFTAVPLGALHCPLRRRDPAEDALLQSERRQPQDKSRMPIQKVAQGIEVSQCQAQVRKSWLSR